MVEILCDVCRMPLNVSGTITSTVKHTTKKQMIGDIFTRVVVNFWASKSGRGEPRDLCKACSLDVLRKMLDQEE